MLTLQRQGERKTSASAFCGRKRPSSFKSIPSTQERGNKQNKPPSTAALPSPLLKQPPVREWQASTPLLLLQASPPLHLPHLLHRHSYSSSVPSPSTPHHSSPSFPFPSPLLLLLPFLLLHPSADAVHALLLLRQFLQRRRTHPLRRRRSKRRRR